MGWEIMRNLHESAAKSILVVLLFFVFIFLGLLVTCHVESKNIASFFKPLLGVRTKGTFQKHTCLLTIAWEKPSIKVWLWQIWPPCQNPKNIHWLRHRSDDKQKCLQQVVQCNVWWTRSIMILQHTIRWCTWSAIRIKNYIDYRTSTNQYY